MRERFHERMIRDPLTIPSSNDQISHLQAKA
jgi:hypothetical protein